MLGPSLAHPGHPTEVCVGQVFTEFKFDYLTALEVEPSAHTETFQRKIEDKTAKFFSLGVQVEPQGGGSFEVDTLRAARFGNRKVVHSFGPVGAWHFADSIVYL